MVEIRINYETLFDLLRREKNREELQTLDPDFYDQVLAYMGEKQSSLERKDETLVFSAEREKLKVQFHNIRRIVKELYERREKKIINLALIKARTGSDVIDTSAMLPVEKAFFKDQVALFSRYKEEVLNSILSAKAKESALSPQEESEPLEIEESATRKVRIVDSLPKFMGLKGEVLGPFEKGAVVELDPQIAEILLKKGRAEELS